MEPSLDQFIQCTGNVTQDLLQLNGPMFTEIYALNDLKYMLMKFVQLITIQRGQVKQKKLYIRVTEKSRNPS